MESNNTLTAAHRRVLTEMCGIKHDKDIVPDYPTWDTGNDLIAVKDKLVKSGEWDAFYWSARIKWFEITPNDDDDDIEPIFTAWLLQPERFCFLAAEWKIQQKGDK